MVWIAELIAFVGLASVLYGVSQWSTPAAWILLGFVLLARAGTAIREERAKASHQTPVAHEARS